MFYSGALWIDPVVSLVIVAVIFYSTLGLLRDSLNLALDAVPRGINPEQVKAFLRSLPEVESVHDLHIWPMSTTETALTVHLVRKTSGHTDAFLATISQVLHEKFQIDHPTIQIETGEAANACRLAPEEVV